MGFVSRAGVKLDHALTSFGLDVSGVIAADFGCNAGGFTDCLLQRGAGRVYAIDTGYGMLDYRLRRDRRVVVMERTNAMHVTLPEPVGLVVIDVAWTRQRHILPAARRVLGVEGAANRLTPLGVVTLVKPHYEAGSEELRQGVLRESCRQAVVERVWSDVAAAGFELRGWTVSPLRGSGGNEELLAYLMPVSGASRIEAAATSGS